MYAHSASRAEKWTAPENLCRERYDDCKVSLKAGPFFVDTGTSVILPAKGFSFSGAEGIIFKILGDFISEDLFMKGRISSEYGEILVDSDVIATYTGSVAVSCFGIVGMAAYSMKDGLVHLLRRDSLKYGINVRIDNNRISLTIHCIVAYGVSILTVYKNLSEAVRYKVEQFTGLNVDRVDVVVEGIRVIDE